VRLLAHKGTDKGTAGAVRPTTKGSGVRTTANKSRTARPCPNPPPGKHTHTHGTHTGYQRHPPALRPSSCTMHIPPLPRMACAAVGQCTGALDIAAELLPCCCCCCCCCCAHQSEVVQQPNESSVQQPSNTRDAGARCRINPWRSCGTSA
jgi:hypothetical protein